MKINTEETLSGPVISLTFTTEDSVNELKNERGFIVGLTPAEAAELRDELTRALDKIAPKTRTPADVLTDPQPLRDPKTEPEIGDVKCWLNIGETQTAEVTAVYYGDFKAREVDVLVDGEHGDCWTIAKWSERWDGVYWVIAKTGETSDAPPPTT